MYVRISTAQLQPGKMDELIDGYEKYWANVPQKGLRGGRQLLDRATDKLMSVTVWDNLADMEVSDSIHKEDVPRYMHAFLAPPTREVYEVGGEIEPAGGAEIRHQGQTLYARVLTVHIQPGKIDEMIDEYQRYASTLLQQPGFRGGRQLIDRAANKLVSITAWDSQANLEASDSIHKEDTPRYMHIFLAPPTREIYEVGGELYLAREVEDA